MSTINETSGDDSLFGIKRWYRFAFQEPKFEAGALVQLLTQSL